MVEGGIVAGVVVSIVIDVYGDDIVAVLARIPIGVAGVTGVPDPDDVVNTLHVDHLIDDQLIELGVACTVVCSPPEPTPTGLMERTEDAGHTFILQIKEVVGHGMDVLDHVLIER